jgi:predicted DNA-binding transcriptional regulator YafY
MPKKIDSHRSSSEKVISLFAKLLFTREKFSLIQLAKFLNCSKQTVIKNIQEIQSSYGVEIEESSEGRCRCYQINRDITPPKFSLTEEEIHVLFMCRAFTEHILGKDLFDESSRNFEKGIGLRLNDKNISFSNFDSKKIGRIDYTPHRQTIHTLIEAMNENKSCYIKYKSISAASTNTVSIRPVTIFTYYDALYVNGFVTANPTGITSRKYEFEPILAVHRIIKAEINERDFKQPENYDFEKHFNERFDIKHDDSFTVKVEFSKFAAEYAAERIWSSDQSNKRFKDGRLHLTFEATSEPEVIAKILSFGAEVKVLEPEWLAVEIKKTINKMAAKYKKYKT